MSSKQLPWVHAEVAMKPAPRPFRRPRGDEAFPQTGIGRTAATPPLLYQLQAGHPSLLHSRQIRPDISYVVGVVNPYMSNSKKSQLDAVRRILM